MAASATATEAAPSPGHGWRLLRARSAAAAFRAEETELASVTYRLAINMNAQSITTLMAERWSQ